MEAQYPEECIKVLNHGFVRLVDVMGDDSSIVQAARVSYGVGTKTVNDDNGLIRYLLRHRHTTPFEMVEFKFHMRMPIFVARQLIRHRTASVNEYSGRYSEMPELFYEPKIDRLTKQSITNKQGSSLESINVPEYYQGHFAGEQRNSYNNYKTYLDTGMSKELARINLPLSTYTEWYWKIDLHNLFHCLKLRMDSHAQYEIRVFAEAMAQYVKQRVPIAYAAFEDYHLNAMTLSAVEVKAIQNFIINGSTSALNFDNKREGEEYMQKIDKLLGRWGIRI